MPIDEPIDRLAAQVEKLSSEIAELRQRVSVLERAAVVPSSPAITTAAPASPPAEIASHLPATNTGLKLLNRAGALTLFMGMVFFFKYAVDNQWIGAVGRIVLGVLAGLALLAAGEWLRKRGQTVFAQGLSACGIAIVYIAVYAASDYYKLIHAASAFVLFLAISAGALLLSIRSSDAVLAVVSYLCAFAALGLFRLMAPSLWSANFWSWFGFVYLLILEALVVIQARVEGWRLLTPILAAAATMVTFWVINPGHPMVCVVFFLALAALHFRPPKMGRAARMIAADAYVLGHIFVLLAGLRFLLYWFGRVVITQTRSSALSESESVFLGLYGVVLLAWAVLRKSAVDRVIGLTLLALVILKLYVVDVWLLARFYRISAFVALGLLLLASSFIYSRWKQSFTQGHERERN